MIVFDCFEVQPLGPGRGVHYEVRPEGAATAARDQYEFSQRNCHMCPPVGAVPDDYTRREEAEFIRMRVAARNHVRGIGLGVTLDHFPAANLQPCYFAHFGPDEDHNTQSVGLNVRVSARTVAALAGYLLVPANLNEPTAGGLYRQLVERFGIGQPWQVRFFGR